MRWQFVGEEKTPLAESLRALAESRGWSEAEVESLLAFLEPDGGRPRSFSGHSPGRDLASQRVHLPPHSSEVIDALRGHAAYQAALERIEAAAMGQRIILFGDYDADGITAVAQIHRFLAAAGFRVLDAGGRRDVLWFVPDRMRHGYGLTKAAADECLATCREEWARSRVQDPGRVSSGKTAPRRGRGAGNPEPPILLIALDCGSTSVEVIDELKKAQGIDCIVVDHHQPPDLGGKAHPAVAHLNPHAWEGDEPGWAALRLLSASGLAWYFCAALAQDLGGGEVGQRSRTGARRVGHGGGCCSPFRAEPRAGAGGPPVRERTGLPRDPAARSGQTARAERRRPGGCPHVRLSVGSARKRLRPDRRRARAGGTAADRGYGTDRRAGESV